jgi:hypothetical protein
MTTSGLPENAVIRATVFGFTYPAVGQVKPNTGIRHDDEILVLLSGTWIPPGCETWSIDDESFSEWIPEHVVLAMPPQ